MLVSNDFAIRMMGHLFPQVPGDKKDVYDNNFEGIMRKIGPQQAFIDISRCKKLTTLPFKCFQLCKSLLYLDISFTHVNDLSVICNHCYDLRGLNISGVQAMDKNFSPVAKLPSLEILTMRYSNVLAIGWIEQLPCLRSLDLGGTTVECDPTWQVRNLTRLQELVLDCATFPIELSEEAPPCLQMIDVFSELPSLKLLNICESSLAPYSEQIAQAVGRPILIESAPRRWLLLAAIAENDFRAVYRMVTTGHDIDSRVTPADEVFMAKLWRARGTAGKLRAPFFLCASTEENLRPNALHFAVYFNAMECVQILLDCGADETLPVWFSDIKEVEGKIIENASLSSKQPTKVYSAFQLVEAVFQRNVHRLTAGFVAKKVAGWKAITTMWYKRLLFVFNAPKGGYRLTGEEMDRKLSSMWVETGQGEPEDADADLASLGEDSTVASAAQGRPGSPSALPAGLSGKSRPGTVGSDVEGGAPVMTRSRRGPVLGGESFKAPAQSGEGDDGDEDEDQGGVGSTSVKEAPVRHDKIIARKPRLCEWRTHGIVEKVIGQPVVLAVKVPVTEAPVEVAAPGKGKGTARHRGSILVKPKVEASQKFVPGDSSRRLSSSKESFGASSKGFGASAMSSNGSWVASEGTEAKYETIELPLLGKQSFWMESRANTIRDREEAYERTVLPEVGRHKLDAVERRVRDMAKLRPAPPTPDGMDAAEESESVINSGDNTPTMLSTSATPFMSPPGSASSAVRNAVGSRESASRGAMSSRDSPSRGRPLATLDERGVFIPDPAVLAATASMKRLSSSERRERFFVQLSQRMEDRYLPDD